METPFIFFYYTIKLDKNQNFILCPLFYYLLIENKKWRYKTNKEKVYNYVMRTPHNTNPNVLTSLLTEPVSWNDLADKPFGTETKTVMKELILYPWKYEEA